MRFLRRRNREQAGTQHQTASTEPSSLDPVAVLLADRIVEGWISRQDRRLSDALNAGDPLMVHIGGSSGASGTWEQFGAGEVVAVAAPPRPDNSPRRIARRRHGVALRAEPYLISGTVHMPPGADPVRFVRSATQRWLALTGCTISAADEEWLVDVVIVNLDHVSQLDPVALT